MLFNTALKRSGASLLHLQRQVLIFSRLCRCIDGGASDRRQKGTVV